MKFVLSICLLLTSIHSHAALNKWVDADGKVHYSDTAPADVKTQKLKSPGTPDAGTQEGSAPPQKTIAEREAEWKKEQKSKEESTQKAAQEKEAAAIKKKNCENARSNLTNYEKSPLIVTYDAKGERKILDEATRKKETDDARKAVSSYCN